MTLDADVIVVGAGLAGLTAAAELTDAGKRVLLLDQEGEQNLGGQAYWSFGGLFLVDSPEQRRLRVKDSVELAWQDWLGTAGFDRPEDEWARRWARAYVEFAAGEKRAWLHAMGHRLFPVVGWAERGAGSATGHGNSVPRFHVTWGTGPGVVEPFERRVREAADRGLLELRFRHRVDAITTTGGVVDGVSGALLEPTAVARGESSSRAVVGEFALRAQAVVVTAGGIGGNHDLVRAAWPSRLGSPPEHLISGVPAHVDGRMLAIAEKTGAAVAHQEDHREGVRAVGLRAEPRPDGTLLATGPVARPSRHRRPGPGVPRPRRRLRHGTHPARAGHRDEPGHGRAARPRARRRRAGGAGP